MKNCIYLWLAIATACGPQNQQDNNASLKTISLISPDGGTNHLMWISEGMLRYGVCAPDELPAKVNCTASQEVDANITFETISNALSTAIATKELEISETRTQIITNHPHFANQRRLIEKWTSKRDYAQNRLVHWQSEVERLSGEVQTTERRIQEVTGEINEVTEDLNCNTENPDANCTEQLAHLQDELLDLDFTLTVQKEEFSNSELFQNQWQSRFDRFQRQLNDLQLTYDNDIASKEVDDFGMQTLVIEINRLRERKLSLPTIRGYLELEVSNVYDYSLDGVELAMVREVFNIAFPDELK